MQKLIRQLIVMASLMLATTLVGAEECHIENTSVRSVSQEADGNIYITVDKEYENCSHCSNRSQFAFEEGANEKFYIAAAITALNVGSKLDVWGNDSPCLGGSAQLTRVIIKAKE